jgi:hypothetical protein
MPALSPNILFPIIFVVIGLVLLFIYFLNLAKVRASQAWPTAQGTVLQSWVRKSSSTDDDGGTSYSYHPEIHYQYQVMGKEYQGNKIAFGPKVGGNRSRAEKMMEKYPTGANVSVYYQPDNPANAVLERSISKISLVMGVVFILAGVFIYARWG